MPIWREIQAEQAAHRELIKAQLQLARELGIEPFKKESSYEVPKEFSERADTYNRTLEQFNRRENRRLRPYSWITTSPYK